MNARTTFFGAKGEVLDESQKYEAEARRSGRRSARKLKKAPVLNGAAGEGGGA